MTNEEFLKNKLDLFYNISLYDYDKAATIAALLKNEFIDDTTKYEFRKILLELLSDPNRNSGNDINDDLNKIKNIYDSLGFEKNEGVLGIIEIYYYSSILGSKIFENNNLISMILINSEIPNFFLGIEKQIFFESICNVAIQSKDPEKIKFVLDKLLVSTVEVSN